MYVIFHELELGVEWIIPHDLEVIDCDAELFVPVEVFAHKHGILDIHLDCRDVFVDYLYRRLVVLQRGNFISELCYFGHDFSKSKGSLLILRLL